jgi:hypothetical protein
VFRLTRAMLERGVCADLAGVDGVEDKFAQRASAAVALLREAGVTVVDDTATDSGSD